MVNEAPFNNDEAFKRSRSSTYTNVNYVRSHNSPQQQNTEQESSTADHSNTNGNSSSSGINEARNSSSNLERLNHPDSPESNDSWEDALPSKIPMGEETRGGTLKANQNNVFR